MFELNASLTSGLRFLGLTLSVCALVNSIDSASAVAAESSAKSQAPVYLPKTFQSGNVTLKGHLALPANRPAKVPVVLILVGSGVTNRYSDLPAAATADQKPATLFKEIEDKLLASGVAVFAYDKRGVEPTDASYFYNRRNPLFQTATANNLALDAVRAFDFVSTLPEVDSTKIILLGHSEGSQIAQRIAAARPQVYKLYLMGLLTRSLDKGVEHQQIANMMRQFYVKDSDFDGCVTQEEYEDFKAKNRAQFPYLDSEDHVPSWAKVLGLDKNGDKRICEVEARYYYEQTSKGRLREIRDTNTPWELSVPKQWFLEFFEHGPWLKERLPFCTKTRVFQGEIDIATPFEDALELRDACVKNQTPLLAMKSYPGLGHVFSPRIGYRNWMDTAGPADPRVAEDVAAAARADLK